jgi:hypothetical protein
VPSAESGVHRRRLLGALAVAAAGCTARSRDPTETAADDGSPRPVAREFSTADGVCGVGPDVATVTFGPDGVRVEGRLVVPTPCHGAALAGATVEDDVLTVAVARTPPPGTDCVQCRGERPYEAVVRFDGALPAAVEVVHDRQPVTAATR